MTNITEKNTKTQIFQAYQEAMTQLKKVSRTTVADEQEAKRVAGVIENAQNIVDMGILNPEITNQFTDLQEAIELAKKELDELFGIKAEALSFEAVVNAKNDEMSELDAKIKAKKAEAEARLEDANKQYENIVAGINKDIQDKRKAIEVERKRETEEYNYSVKRMRQIENDAWEDEKSNREKELSIREDAVSDREYSILDKENELQELREKVAMIPELIADAEAKAKDEAKAKAQKSFMFEKSHLTKEHNWALQTATDKADALESQLRNAQDAKTTLEAKLERAYGEIRELATTTVQSSGVKVIETTKAN